MEFQQQAALTICGAVAFYVVYKRYCTPTIRDIPGPKSPSWIHGHLWWWCREEASVVEKHILDGYGTVARWNGSLGERRLWVADPKAIHHILQNSSLIYEKPSVNRELLTTLIDNGIVTAEGYAHKRQRRAMTPAFGLVEAKALYPCFVRCSDSVADKWNEIISNTESGQAAIIDVHAWLSKVALDAIGAGAFDYDFGAVEGTDNKLTKSYANLGFGAYGKLTKSQLFVIDSFKWFPEGFGTWMMERDKRPGAAKLRENRGYMHEVAAKLIEDKKQELKDGTSRKDLLSSLIKANSALRPDWRLKDEEIVPQIRTIMFAGHETTAKALTVALWELAKRRSVQERLRAEVMETLGRIRARGDSDFNADDFDSMPYLLAVVKEILRFHPPVIDFLRIAKEDDALPLSKPIVGLSGKVYNEILVPKETLMTISLMGYNLNKDLWGPDAYEFRPERWLDAPNDKLESPIGVYSNLLTFSGGPRSCIGWRFALIEIHTLVVTLVRQFDFSLPDDGRKIWKMRPMLLTPVVVGEEDKGPQMPLKVTALKNE